jgi:hypothetical protein
MSDVVETAGKYRVRAVMMQDSAEFNPRSNQDCNLANVITPEGQRYIDVDEDGGPLAENWDRVAERDDAVEVFTRWARVFHGITVIEDRPHDGARSLWYVTPENLKETTLTADKVVEAEIEEYRRWAEGEVYGWVVEKDVTRIPKDPEDAGDPDIDDESRAWEHVDSCWGYIGRENVEDAAREGLSQYSGEDVTA